MTPRLEAEKRQKAVSLEIDEIFLHVTQATDQLKVFQAREMSVDMSLLRNVPKGSAIALEIQSDTLAFEEHLSGIGFEQASDDLDGSGLARTVWSQITDDLTRADTKTNLVYGGKTTVALAESFDFEHRYNLAYPM